MERTSRKHRPLVAFGLLFSVVAAAQTDSIQINKKRLVALSATTAVAYTGTLVALDQIWYSAYDRQSFQFFNDASQWKQMDKAGHFLSSFQLSDFSARALRWSHVPTRKADIVGTVAGFCMISSIEWFDGRSAAYGASASDLTANLVGSLFFLAQRKQWNEIRIVPKFSFHFTDFAAQRPDVLGHGGEEIIKDYNGQTYWLSWNPHALTGAKNWPRWLDLSIGYGAEEMTSARDGVNVANRLSPYRQYYLSVDLNAAGLRVRSKVLRSILAITRYIKIPAPAVAFSKKGIRVHGLYF